MEKTAVEFLVEHLNIKYGNNDFIITFENLIQQAKEMEKQQQQLDLTNITRLEVINHAKNSHTIGRLLTMHKETEDFTVVDAEFQDSGRTLKIFVS